MASFISVILIIVLAVYVDKKVSEKQKLATLKAIESLEATAAGSDDYIEDYVKDPDDEDVIILE